MPRADSARGEKFPVDILRLENLHKHFGGIAALNGVSLAVDDGERRALIGPNGAGKTTLFNLISGELPPTTGRIIYRAQNITRLPSHRRAALGMARTFQRNNLFLGLSVWENVRLAAHPDKGAGVRAFAAPNGRARDLIEHSLARVGLHEQRDMPARNLSYGEQRQLELAIALATQPNMILLDEPAAGMSPAETQRLMGIVREMPRDITLLIIEHDMDLIFALADRITVLHYGEVIADGEPYAVKNDARVKEAYLGT